MIDFSFKKRVMFMGTSDFSIPTLSACVESGLDLVAVVTKSPKRRGRGRKVGVSPVENWASRYSLPVYSPETSAMLVDLYRSILPNLIIVVAYGMLIPEIIIDNVFCVNSHASLLPKYRGASPIRQSLLNGDLETGITYIHMDYMIDTGDILDQERITIGGSDDYETLSKRLSLLSAVMLRKMLTKNVLFSTKQEKMKESYCKKISREDAYLSDDCSALERYRIIKAFSPKPGAYVIRNNKKIIIKQASYEPMTDRLIPLRVKPESKSEMSYQDFLCGYPPIYPL